MIPAATVAQVLAEARQHLHAALHALASLHDRIKETEGGLDHVMRQVQNADIIAMFMEREWRAAAQQPPSGFGRLTEYAPLDLDTYKLDEAEGFEPLPKAAVDHMLNYGTSVNPAAPSIPPEDRLENLVSEPAICPDCGGEGLMHKTWCRR